MVRKPGKGGELLLNRSDMQSNLCEVQSKQMCSLHRGLSNLTRHSLAFPPLEEWIVSCPVASGAGYARERERERVGDGWR